MWYFQTSATAGPWRQLPCVQGRNKGRQEGPVFWLCVWFRLMVQKGQKEEVAFPVNLHPVSPLFSYSKTSGFISTLLLCLRQLCTTHSFLPFDTPPFVLVPILSVRAWMGSLFIQQWDSFTLSQIPKLMGISPHWDHPRPAALEVPPRLGPRARLSSGCVEVLGRMAAHVSDLLVSVVFKVLKGECWFAVKY